MLSTKCLLLLCDNIVYDFGGDNGVTITHVLITF